MSDDEGARGASASADMNVETSRNVVSSLSDHEENIEPPAFSLATLGLQRVGTVQPPKPKPQMQAIQMLNARGMPARIRKRNKFFFDDDIINDDKPLRMSLSPKKAPMKPIGSSYTATMKASPAKVLKKRKGVVSRYMRIDEKRKLTNASLLTSSKDKKLQNDRDGPSGSGVSSSGIGISKMIHRLGTIKRTTSSSSTSSSTDSIKNDTKLTTTDMALLAYDKNIGQSIGMRLRNLLKLPKAHKWVIAEWFYSYIDRPLFEGESDFSICLNELFPGLKTRQLTRHEWRKVRQLLGKPRRTSQAFFDEERRELERKRQKIRYLQARKSGDLKDLMFLRDLPDKIPLPLPIGTKVTARLRIPQDGIFGGHVEAYDSLNAIYRVTFDRQGLGTHSIPDYEIVSENFNEMLPIQSITKDFRPNLMSLLQGSATSAGTGTATGVIPHITPLKGGILGLRSALNQKLNRSDPLLGQETIDSPFRNQLLARDNAMNGYPPKLLETVVRLRRAIAIKRSKVQRLSDMNDEAELQAAAYDAPPNYSSSDESCCSTPNVPHITEEFQRRYASIVITMEKINRDMMIYLNEVQKFSPGLSRDPHIQAMLAPSYLREKCRSMADSAVEQNNQGQIKNPHSLNLIKNLTTLLVVSSHLGGTDNNNSEVAKVLEGCMEETRTSLMGANVEVFQKHVQLHLHHIRLGIGKNAMTSNSNSNNNNTNKTNISDSPPSAKPTTTKLMYNTIEAKKEDEHHEKDDEIEGIETIEEMDNDEKSHEDDDDDINEHVIENDNDNEDDEEDKELIDQMDDEHTEEESIDTMIEGTDKLNISMETDKIDDDGDDIEQHDDYEN